MTEQKNIIIPLTEESDLKLKEIIKKYDLEENLEDFFSKVRKNISFNEIVVIKLTRDLMMEKISTYQFLDKLKEGLSITTEKTKNLAIDIKNNLMPLLKKYTEEDLKNYKSPKKPLPKEEENTVASIILEKIRGHESNKEDEVTPIIKKPEIKDVEKNAEILKVKGKIGQDIYKESIE